jgi:hypothetical protein
MLAAVMACGADAVLSHHSAAALPNVIRWQDRYPDVLVLGESAPQHPRINGHRTSYLPPEHVTTWRGIPITTAERTLLDLAGELTEARLRRAIRPHSARSWRSSTGRARSVAARRSRT